MALIGYINLQNCWKMGKARFDFHQNELFRFPMVEHTIKKSNPMFIFINGLFGCVFIRDRENEK